MGEYTYIQDPHNLYTVYDFLDAIKDYIPKDEGIEFEELHSFYPRIREEKLRELIKMMIDLQCVRIQYLQYEK